MKILQCIGTLNPAYGGPVEALRLQGICFEAMGFNTTVLTLDGAYEPRAPDIRGQIVALGPSAGRFRFNTRMVSWLKQFGSSFSLIVIHGVWQFQSLACWIASMSVPLNYVIFTHGALDPWFRLRFPLKHLKKAAYWRLIESRVLSRARAILFTAEKERTLAMSCFPFPPVETAVVGYGILDVPINTDELIANLFAAHPLLKDKSLLLFMSRIDEKKGLDILIRAFASIASSSNNVYLVIAGPGTDQKIRAMRRLCRSLGIDDRTYWLGMLTGDAKWGAFYAADVFALPSHSENFGVVIAESLACGLPVLISDKVNIFGEIQMCHAGLIDDDSVEGMTHLLATWLELSKQDQEKMRQNAKICFQRHFRMEASAVNVTKFCLPSSEAVNCQL